MSRTALFVIDIQVDLALDSATEIPYAERIRNAGTAILNRARGLIDTARVLGEQPPLEIVFVQHEEDAKKGPLVRGSRPWQLVFNSQGGDDSEMLVSKDVREFSTCC